MTLSASIIVAATDSNDAVDQCLASMSREFRDRVIVAFDPARIDVDLLPIGLTRVAGQPGDNAHRLRILGACRTLADILVFTEDSCRFGPNWSEWWLKAFEDPEVLAATGPVEPDRGNSSIDEAVFLCEYAPFLSDASRLSYGRLAGNNFAVRRAVLDFCTGDVHESEVAEQVCRLGGTIRLAPEALVHHSRRYSLESAICDRLRFGFGFGRFCARVGSPLRRFSRILFGPGILVSQLGRLAWTLARKRRGGEAILSAGLLTVVLLLAWSVAEWLGWIVGPSQKSCETTDPRLSTRTAPPTSLQDDYKLEPSAA